MRTLLDSVVVLIVLFGFTLFLLPFFSFETIKPIVDSFARDNSADMFTRQGFDAFGRLGGVVALVFFLAATCIIFFKGRLASYLNDLLDSFRRLLNDFLSYVLQVWQGTRRSEKAVVVGVFTAGVLLRAYFLADPIRNFDEAYTHYYFSSRGLIPHSDQLPRSQQSRFPLSPGSHFHWGLWGSRVGDKASRVPGRCDFAASRLPLLSSSI